MPVLAVLAVVIVWRYTIKGKGNPAARLAALLCAVVVVWVLVGFKDLSVAGSVAEGFASGISQAAAGFAAFLSHF